MHFRDQKSKIWGRGAPPPATMESRRVPRHHIPNTCLDSSGTPPSQLFLNNSSTANSWYSAYKQICCIFALLCYRLYPCKLVCLLLLIPRCIRWGRKFHWWILLSPSLHTWHRRRRRDSTVELRRVGVGGMYCQSRILVKLPTQTNTTGYTGIWCVKSSAMITPLNSIATLRVTRKMNKFNKQTFSNVKK